jgi:hypothetical protein
MAKYATTKVLKKASPTVRTADQVVKSWEVEVLYTHTRDNGTTWARAYPATEDVEYLNKTADQFTKAELIGYMNPNMDVIFDAHYEAHNLPATEEKVSNFNLNDLA